MEEKLLEKADKVNVGKVILTFIMSVFGIALITSIGGVVMLILFNIGLGVKIFGSVWLVVPFLSIRSYGGKNIVLATILSILFASFAGYFFYKIAIVRAISNEINIEKLSEEKIKEMNSLGFSTSESDKSSIQKILKSEFEKVGIDVDKMNFRYVYNNLDEVTDKVSRLTSTNLEDEFKLGLFCVYLYILGGFVIFLFDHLKNKFKKPKSDSLEKEENNTPSTDSSESKDVWVCPKCGASNPVGTMLCQNCEK